MDPDKIFAELKQYDFEVIWSNLPEEQEQKLRSYVSGHSSGTALFRDTKFHCAPRRLDFVENPFYAIQ